MNKVNGIRIVLAQGNKILNQPLNTNIQNHLIEGSSKKTFLISILIKYRN